MKKSRGFSFIEILIVVGIIAILGTIVVLAINPGRQFAKANNTRRRSDVIKIADAITQYAIEHEGRLPEEIDDTLKVIGTASTGCGISCESELGKSEESIFSLIQTAYAASGWVSPTGYEDPGDQWTQEPNAYDKNVGTYSQNTYRNIGWSQFIVLTLTAPITSDRLRVYTDYTDADISAVDVDVLKDGVWVDVFQGGNEAEWNCRWVELAFSEGSVSAMRFRYNYRTSYYYYWLYEVQFYEKEETITLPSCLTQNALSVEETTAILKGTVLSDGGEPAEYRFQYGESSINENSTTWKSGKITGDSLSELVSNLSNNSHYYFQAQVRNSAGTADCSIKEFTTGPVTSGWVSFTGFSDPDSNWENEDFAYDTDFETAARSYHDINDPQWSSFLYLTHQEILADKIRFYGRGGAEVSSVDIDILKDGAWEDLYQGSFNDKEWVEEDFLKGSVTQLRIRFYAASISQGFFWELYEIEIEKATEESAESCIDLSSILVPNYLLKIPSDPTKGSEEVSYYAIKKDVSGRLVIKACGAELGENIAITR